jgi:hypothetical protein
MLAELVDDCTSPRLAGAISGVRFADFFVQGLSRIFAAKKIPAPCDPKYIRIPR